MRKKILITLAILVGILLIFAGVIAMQPADYSVTRSATMTAPRPLIFGLVNNLKNWDAWSPWAKLDPDAKSTFEGADYGKGAIMKWSGNSQVGEGQMTITDSQSTDLIKIQTDFVRPFKDTSNVEFTFKTRGDQTTVTWTMHGHKGFMSKGVCMFVDMDKMLGGDFEKGLGKMKELVEKPKSEIGAWEVPGAQPTNPPAAK